MNTSLVIEAQKYYRPVTLLGGGGATPDDLRMAMARAPHLVAADGGANLALSWGVRPERVIGDMDSLSSEARAALPATALCHVAEQDSTDFEKCLMRTEAPLILGVGFLGGRLDHTLAALSVLVRRADPVMLIGAEDVVLAAPPRLHLPVAAGTRVSLYPLGPIRGQSSGLEWPIDGIAMAPGGRVGTSNRATGPVDLSFESRGMVVLLPRACLDIAMDAVRTG